LTRGAATTGLGREYILVGAACGDGEGDTAHADAHPRAAEGAQSSPSAPKHAEYKSNHKSARNDTEWITAHHMVDFNDKRLRLRGAS
jgi:hypothetical protein